MLILNKRLADMTPSELAQAQDEIDTLHKTNIGLLEVSDVTPQAERLKALLKPFTDFAEQYLLARFGFDLPHVSADTPMLVTTGSLSDDEPKTALLWKHFFEAMVELRQRRI